MNSLCTLTSMTSSVKQKTFTYDVQSLGAYSTIIASSANVYASTGVATNADYTKMVLCRYGPSASNNGFLYYSTKTNGVWSALLPFDTTNRLWIGIQLTADGTRGAAIARDEYCYYFTWTGSSPSTITQTLQTTAKSWNDLTMSANGSTIATVVSSDYPYYATWDGSNYSAFTQTLETTIRAYNTVALSANGNIMCYAALSGSTIPRYATWNGTNYSNSSNLGSTALNIRRLRMTTDAYTIFVSGALNYYATYNGTSYSAWTTISTSELPTGTYWSLEVVNNNNYLLSSIHNSTANNVNETQLYY